MSHTSVQRDVDIERSSVALRRYSLQLQSMLRTSKVVIFYDNIYKQLIRVQKLIKADEVIFNHIDRERNQVMWHHILPSKNAFISVKIRPIGDIVGVVAFRKEHILVKNILKINDDYPNIFVANEHKNSEMTLLCLPVKNFEGECISVLELYKKGENVFSEIILKYVMELCFWIGIALDQSIKSLQLTNAHAFTTKLMTCTSQYFSGEQTFQFFLTCLVPILRTNILADRFILYELIKDGREADIFTEIGTVQEERCMKIVKRIKIKKKSIVRHVIDTKQIFNGEVEVNDPRIDQEIHQLMGECSPIETCCCIPIILDEKVAAVFKIVNKQTFPSKFLERDLRMIGLFCDFLTHGIYKKVNCEEVANEAAKLDFYEELLITQLRKTNINQEICVDAPIIPEGFSEFSWVPDENSNLSSIIYYIITEACPNLFVHNTLREFIMVVRALHRDNSFHNFSQCFAIVHAVYALIKIIPMDFDVFEKSGLLLAALINYIDHRAMDYSTLKLLDHPITRIYKTMNEYRIDLGIFLIENSKLLDHLSIHEKNQILKIYSSALKNLKAFETQKDKYIKIFESKFSINIPTHRALILNFLYWCAVNSRHFKNFRFAKRTCENLYQEYFKNGETDIKIGVIPLPIKDRKFTENIPDFELVFLETIVLPYFTILKKFFPSTEPIYDATMSICNAFRELIELRGKKTWLPDESLGLSLG